MITSEFQMYSWDKTNVYWSIQFVYTKNAQGTIEIQNVYIIIRNDYERTQSVYQKLNMFTKLKCSFFGASAKFQMFT